jgi:hypothetical protein
MRQAGTAAGRERTRGLAGPSVAHGYQAARGIRTGGSATTMFCLIVATWIRGHIYTAGLSMPAIGVTDYGGRDDTDEYTAFHFRRLSNRAPLIFAGLRRFLAP